MRTARAAAAILAFSALATACDQTNPTAVGPAFNKAPVAPLPHGDGAVSPVLDSINHALVARDLNVQIARAEFVLANRPGDAATGQVIFANDRAKRLTSGWVGGDGRRLADGDRITWLDLDPFMAANGAGGPVDAGPAVDAAFATWGKQTCTTLDVAKRAWDGTTNPSAILDLGIPSDPFAADISVLGYLPGSLFDLVLGDGAAENVLGVTFTFVFVDGDGHPTDINHDGHDDTALKEIWFNNEFIWTTTGLGGAIDAETVALHESGHAFELGHFGRIFGTLGNLTLHVAPRAVMNAVILGTLRSPLGTDNAAFCGFWSAWPR